MGFELLRNPTNVENFMDDNEVKTKYYPEIEALILRATGATELFIFDHTIRKSTIDTYINKG